MSPQWLTALVRARQVEEDAAKTRLADARRTATRARMRAAREDAYIDDLCGRVDDHLTAPAFAAAAASLQSAAAAHSAAVFAIQQADLGTAARLTELRTAATALGAAEKLSERIEAAERAKLLAAEQAQLDETAAHIHRVARRRPS